MNTSPDANRRERAEGPDGRRRPRGGPRRWLLLAGAAACLGAVGLVTASHLHTPWPARGETPTPQSAAPSPAGQKPPGPGPSASPTPAGAPASRATAEQLRDEAFATVRQLIADYPQNANAASLMGTLHFAFKDPEEAEKWWYKALELDPNGVGNHMVLATAAAIRGDLDTADRLWRRAQTLAPDTPGVYRGHAAVLLRAGKADEAVATLEKELALSPADPRCFALLGKAHLQRKDYEKAVDNYRRALEAGPVDPETRFGLATACARLGRNDEAEASMQEFEAMRARQQEAQTQERKSTYFDLSLSTGVLVLALGDAGQTYTECGNPRKAEACWRRAADVDPTNRGCRYHLAELYAAAGRPQDAVCVCRELQAIRPAGADDERALGLLLVRLQQFDAAEAALTRAIERDPKHPAAYRCLVQLLLARSRRLPEARARAETLVELEPSAPNCLLLGQTCHRAGDLPAARAALERALQLDPGNETVQRECRALQQGK